MQSEHPRLPDTTGPTETIPEPDTRGTHPYHAPELTNFGSLVELVQARPTFGRDANYPGFGSSRS